MKNILYKILPAAFAVMLTATAAAEQTAPVAPAPSAETGSNGMLYLILAACAILLIAVLLLGKTLIRLTEMVMDKRAGKTAVVILLLLNCNTLFAQETGTAPSKFNFNFDLVIGSVVLVTELVVVLWMLARINALLAEISGADQKKSWEFSLHLPKFFDNINASVAIEKETDIMLDHNYDGIKELDNSLPPWWKYSFYISIVWSFIYMGYYHFGNGPGSIDEFNTEMQQAKVEVDEYNKKNALNVDETNVKLADAAGILDGQDIFKSNCAACHGNFGEGTVGPNLTDDYWLHGGSLNEVFKSVKYGWPAKGMKSWQSDLSAVQIKNVISYIHTLHGTKPANAKAAEGDLFVEKGTTVVADTLKVDSLAVAHNDTLSR